MSVFCLYCIGVHSSQSRFCQLINSSFLIQARVFCGDALPPRLSYPIAHKVSMRYRLSQPSISPPPPLSPNNPLHYLLRSVCIVVRLSELASRFTLLKHTGYVSISLFSFVSSAKKRTNSTLQPAVDKLEEKTSHKEKDENNKTTRLDKDDLFLNLLY